MRTRRGIGGFCSAAALALALLCGCSDDGATCSDGGRTFRSGDQWTCSDGCNGCACDGDGKISSTAALCTGPPGPAATMLSCFENEAERRHGDAWECSDGCGMCGCDDGTIVRDESACNDGAAGGS